MNQIGAVFGVEAREPRAEGLARRLHGLAHRQFFGHDRRLIGAPDAKSRALEEGQVVDVPSLEEDFAALRGDSAPKGFQAGSSCRRRSGR